MAEGFVKIDSYWSPEEANLAKLRLMSHGIDVELEGETAVGTAWIDANAFGGVKLLVKFADAEDARSILNAKPDHFEALENQEQTGLSSERPEWQSEEFEQEDEDEETATPRVLGRLRFFMKNVIALQLAFGFFFYLIPFSAVIIIFLSPIYWAIVIPSSVFILYLLLSKPKKPESLESSNSTTNPGP